MPLMLYSAGVLGLLDAHAKFDTRKGVKFETYAVWRIKGVAPRAARRRAVPGQLAWRCR